MKLLKIILIASLVSSFALAKEDFKKQNIEKMRVMEKGLNAIQKGFLYNSLNMVKEGSKQIKGEVKLYYKKRFIRSFLPEGKQQMENIAIITSQRLKLAIDELDYYVKENNMRKAEESFTNIVKTCTDCHSIVRGW